MKLLIEIEMDNAVFEDDGEGLEASRVLSTIQNKIEDIPDFSLGDKGSVYDLNGNTVAFWEVRE